MLIWSLSGECKTNYEVVCLNLHLYVQERCCEGNWRPAVARTPACAASYLPSSYDNCMPTGQPPASTILKTTCWCECSNCHQLGCKWKQCKQTLPYHALLSMSLEVRSQWSIAPHSLYACVSSQCKAINSNTCLHFFHFCPDDNWSIQSKQWQVIFQAQAITFLFMQQPTRSHWNFTNPLHVLHRWYLMPQSQT